MADLKLSDLLDNSLDSMLDESIDSYSLDLDSEETEEKSELLEVVQLEEGEIDPRLLLLSHSSRNLVHTCPRKYQLYKLNSSKISLSQEQEEFEGATFAFGHCVGTGIQSVLEDKTETQVYMDMFLAWSTDLLYEVPKSSKSIWTALHSVRKFAEVAAHGALKDYELVYYNGKPAVELSFIVYLPDGFKYRGFIDAVLQHKETKEVLCLEDKTTGHTANPAMYTNSGQALGYSVILDKMFDNLSSYEVMYLVYQSKSMEFINFRFVKTLLKRALWLQELLIECEKIKLYAEYDCFPMHGENCFAFYRECEYLGLCTMATENVSKKLTKGIVNKIEEDNKTYDFHIDFYDLVQSQIDKGEG